jgi:hypothetical protein
MFGRHKQLSICLVLELAQRVYAVADDVGLQHLALQAPSAGQLIV